LKHQKDLKLVLLKVLQWQLLLHNKIYHNIKLLLIY